MLEQLLKLDRKFTAAAAISCSTELAAQENLLIIDVDSQAEIRLASAHTPA